MRSKLQPVIYLISMLVAAAASNGALHKFLQTGTTIGGGGRVFS